MITLGAFFGALTVGAIFWMYSSDLPGHDSLTHYSPYYTVATAKTAAFRD